MSPTGLKPAGQTHPLNGHLPGASITYTVRSGPSLSLAAHGDAVDVVDAKGATVFAIPAPFMDDARGEHSTAVTTTLDTATADHTWTLTATPDRDWLAAAGRAWPVVVDPTIGYPSAMTACTLNSAAATTSACAASELSTSWNSTGGAEKRTTLRFDTLYDVIPADAQLSLATLGLYVVNDTSAVASSVDVRSLREPFTSAATWNTRNGSTAWTTPGGERTATIYERGTLTPNGTYQSLQVTRLVQAYIDGTGNYYGFILQKQAATSGGQPLRFGSPTSANPPSLFIDWNYRTGNRKGNSAGINEQLSDRTSVTVNPATGNAAVTTKELSIKGAGIDLNVAHTSQSLNTAGLSNLGYGWTSSLGATRLKPYAGGTLAAAQTLFYTDGSGGQWTYLRNPNVSTTWLRPAGLDMDLGVSGSTYTLTDRKTRTVQKFKNIGTSTNEIYGLDTIKDKNGNTITFTYDASARSALDNALILRSVTDTRGRQLAITNYAGYYDSFITDSAGRQVIYGNSANQLDQVTDAAGGLVKYEYDAAHRVTAVVTPENLRTEMTYDSTGRITQLKRKNSATAGDSVWGFAYTAFTRTDGVPATKTTVTDPNNHDTVYTSDGRGRNSKVTNALNKTVSRTFSPNDDVATTTAATGSGSQNTTNGYDSADTYRLTSTSIPTGSGSVFTYGTGAQQYNVATAKDARDNTTTLSYDAAGNSTKTQKADGTSTLNLYEGNTDPAYSNAVVHCGPNGAATKLGALCETRDASYVAGSSRAATTGHRTAYEYNALGEAVLMKPPGGGSLGNQTYTYDGLSRLASTTDGKGQSTTYGYDAMDRQTYVLHNDGTVESYYFGGGTSGISNGWLRSLTEYPAGSTTNATRTTTYGRDDLGRTTGVEAPEGDSSLAYDKASNLTVDLDGGGTTAYGYNDADQLTYVQLPGGNCYGLTWSSPGTAANKCVVFNLDDDGRRIGTKYPGGTSNMVTTRDDAGRIKQIVAKTGSTPATQLDLSYAYTETVAGTSKDTSLVTAVTDAVTAKKTSYTHDKQDRLIVASTAPTAGGTATTYERFCYDAAGNRTKYYRATAVTDCNATGAAATSTYNTANQLTAATGVTPTGAALAGTAFSYDANGNETTAKSAIGRTTAYGDRDQATTFTPTGGSASTQKYSGTGNRERVASGSTTFVNSPLAPAPASSTTAGTSTWTVRDPDGKLIAVRIGTSATSATEYYPFTDNLDNVRAMVTATGTTPNVAYTYSAYGTTLSTTGSLVQPYRFGSGYTDTSTNLIKLGVRYYDPVHGRFTQHDPTNQEEHPYLYSKGCPMTSNDPTGGGCSKSDNIILATVGIAAGLATAPALLPLFGASIGAGTLASAAAIQGFSGPRG